MIRRVAALQDAQAKHFAACIQRDERVRRPRVADDVICLRRGLHHMPERDTGFVLHDLHVTLRHQNRRCGEKISHSFHREFHCRRLMRTPNRKHRCRQQRHAPEAQSDGFPTGSR